MSRKKIAVISAVSTIGLLILLMIGYLLYFALGARVLPGIKLGQVDISGKTAAEIEKQLNTVAATEKLTFTGENLNQKSAKLSDFGATFATAEITKAALAPNSNLLNYFKIPFTGKTITPKLDINETKLTEYANKLSDEIPNAQAAVEPKLVVENETFTITPGKSGKSISPKIISDGAQKLATRQKSVPVKVTLSNLEPKYTVADLENAKTTAEKYLETEVSVVAEKKTITASKKTKITWISVNGEKVTINDAALKEWLTKIAQPFNQKEIEGIRNLDNSGKVLEIVEKARAEKKVTNFDTAFNTLSTAFKAHQPAKASFDVEIGKEKWKNRIVAQGAEKLAYKATEGEKWIDVNLSTFKMTAYEGAKRVRGPITVVTGEPNAPTVVGTYKIWYKSPKQDMRGTHSDGSKYHIKNVPSNMFFHGDYAIHGAPWWGPDEWGFRGSNGCVNTPTAEAKWLYDWAPLGTVVVTHY